MTEKNRFKIFSLKKYFLVPGFIFFSAISFSQKTVADSLGKLLSIETKDSTRANLMWNLANSISDYNPDSALILSYQSLSLARIIKYYEGESKAIGILANTLRKIGNYPLALELNIQKLKLEEKQKNPASLASVLISIGSVYRDQEEYRKALEYYTKADSVIVKNNIENLKYYTALNIGDAYNLLDIADSSLTYFNKSLQLAKVYPITDFVGDFTGTSLTGLGHSYLKLGSIQQSFINYQTGIKFLQAAEDDEVLCEATLGLANLYKQLNNKDSSGYYAKMSHTIAKKDGFLSKQLEAAEFLTDHYKGLKNIDSAFTFVNIVKQLNDSLNSKSKIRESQIISSNEHFRQMEIEEESKQDRKQRLEQLQMLLIAIFIPGLFLITLLLSRVNLHIKLIRMLGVLSLLFLFEYLTLLLHPTVARLTHHTPLLEILIFVGVAAILIPLHHRLEHWLIHKLIHHRHRDQTNEMKVVK